MYDYRRLQVWQKAHELTLAVLRSLPRSARRYASLVGQITRAAESVPTNIVEGRAADSDAEFARFLKMSTKSVTELEYHLQLAAARRVISEPMFETFRPQIVEVRKMLTALIRKLEDDDRRGPNRIQK